MQNGSSCLVYSNWDGPNGQPCLVSSIFEIDKMAHLVVFFLPWDRQNGSSCFVYWSGTRTFPRPPSGLPSLNHGYNKQAVQKKKCLCFFPRIFNILPPFPHQHHWTALAIQWSLVRVLYILVLCWTLWRSLAALWRRGMVCRVDLKKKHTILDVGKRN